MKKCSKCGVEKEATTEHFTKQTDGKDGLRPNCKSCQALYRKENKDRICEYRKKYYEGNKDHLLEYRKKYYEENREHYLEYRKKYYEGNREYCLEQKKKRYEENREHYLEQSKQYKRENKERIAERKKQYEQDNKEYIAECHKQYCKGNPEKRIIWEQCRRARKRELDSTLTFEQWENIKQDFNHKCAYCGKEDKLAQEHFLPLSKGGEYTHNNIVPACKSCNSSKGNKFFHEWYPKYKHYNKAREKYLLQHLGYNDNKQQLSIL